MTMNKYGMEKKTAVRKVRDVTWARTVEIETKNISAAGSGNHLHIPPKLFQKATTIKMKYRSSDPEMSCRAALTLSCIGLKLSRILDRPTAPCTLTNEAGKGRAQREGST